MRYSAKQDKKASGRMTPYDKSLGTFAVKPAKEEKVPRKPTKAENRANNKAIVEFASEKVSVKKWIPLFRQELAEMNRNKVGRPYLYCDSMIAWILSLMAMLSISYAMAAGTARGILKDHGFNAPSTSRLFERISDLLDSAISNDDSRDGIYVIMASSNVKSKPRNVGLDSSGFNLSDTTLWKNTKWGVGPVKKGWLKLHALSDVDTGEIIAYAITGDRVGDSPLLIPLITAALERGHRIRKVYADGAYGSVSNFEYVCGEKKMEFITSFKVNTVPKNNGSYHRGKAVRLWCQLPYAEWVRVSGYGRRWKCECTFSDIKRIFRETVNASTIAGSVRKLIMKTEVFNEYKAKRWEIMQQN